jgi:hypothetical protein
MGGRSTTILLLASLVLTGMAFAQIDTATITGAVNDPAGAIIVDAKVTVTNTATNFASETLTNGEGLYRVQSLRPGTYRLEITASGFRRMVRDGVEVRGGDVVAINVKLELGNVTETVQVSGNAALLETETSSTGTVLKGEYFAKLPLYQRDSRNSFYLTPGVTYTGNGYAGGLGGFHIAGMRDNEIGQFEDGMIGTSAKNDNGNAGIDSIQNSVEEIKVLTTTLPAEYGHSAGGVITVVKKTGTNLLHGDASDFGRSRIMQHRKYFDKCRFTQTDPAQGCIAAGIFVLEPDFNVNGPVFIPKVYDGRNKTFFMMGYQKYIEKQAKQLQFTVPTPEMLNGDLSFGGIGNPIYDPRSTRLVPGSTSNYTRDIFPGAKVPIAQFDPVARKVLALNPWTLPNVPAVVTSTGVANNQLLSQQKVVSWDYWTFRLDQQISSRFKLYATTTINNKVSVVPNPNVANPLLDGSHVIPVVKQYTNSAGATWVISPTFVNDTRVGYTRQGTVTDSPAAGTNVGGALFGIPNISPDTFPTGVVPSLPTYSNSSFVLNETLMLRSDFTKMHGRHAIKFGYEVMRFRDDEHSAGSPSGGFTFASTSGLTGSGTQTIANTGNSFASFLVGSLSSASASIPLISWLPRSTMHSFYVQDDWKVSRTLTLNLGVRYQEESPFDTKYHQISNFDPTLPDNVVPGAMGLTTHPKNGLNRRDINNFQPRLGVAWNVKQRLVLRGGFAVNTVDQRLGVDQRSEYSNTSNLSAASGDPRPLYQISAFPGFDAGYPAVRPDGTSPFQGNNYSGRTVTWTDPGIRNPYTLTWNFGVQYEVARNYLLDLSYQGTAGIGLLGLYEFNGRTYDWAMNLRQNDPAQFTAMIGNSQAFRPFTNYGNISFRSNFGHSTYNAGTAKMEKRFSRGLTFLGFYTFSKAIDNSDSDGGGGSMYINGALYKSRAGFDQTHRAVSSFSYELPVGKGRRWMNKGGIANVLLGGWNFVWTYQIMSGTPMSFGYADSPFNYLPGMIGQISGRADMMQRPALRENWQDLGGDRFNTGNQNSVWSAASLGYLTYPGGCTDTVATAESHARCDYTFGNGGANVVNSQRIIAANTSLAKEIQIKERLKFQIRGDWQNPFKWYNWGVRPTTAYTSNVLNAQRNFGKIANGSEASTNNGGVTMLNLTLALVW